MNTQAEFQGRPLMAFRTGAIVVAIVSGFYALAALVVGSPLEFGVALASCGGCWVAADFIEWTVERERAAGRRPVPAVLLNLRWPRPESDGAYEELRLRMECGRVAAYPIPSERRARSFGSAPSSRGQGTNHDVCEYLYAGGLTRWCAPARSVQ
jgi:hypothetical protein